MKIEKIWENIILYKIPSGVITKRYFEMTYKSNESKN